MPKSQLILRPPTYPSTPPPTKPTGPAISPPVTAPTAVCVARLAACVAEVAAMTATGMRASLPSVFIEMIPPDVADFPNWLKYLARIWRGAQPAAGPRLGCRTVGATSCWDGCRAAQGASSRGVGACGRGRTEDGRLRVLSVAVCFCPSGTCRSTARPDGPRESPTRRAIARGGCRQQRTPSSGRARGSRARSPPAL